MRLCKADYWMARIYKRVYRGIVMNLKKKFFNHKRKMKNTWYQGTTGIPPLDHSIKNAIKYGWTHHIERLMILSNIMNLAGIHPKIFINGLWKCL